MKKFAAFTAIVLAVVFSAGLVVSAEPPGKMVIDVIQKSRAPVPFDHAAHLKRAENCKVCHHTSDAKGTDVQSCSAVDCHGTETVGKKLNLREAYHKMCRGCHQEQKAGPTKCDDCHIKS
jgi:hypothetical protein